jgi:hypothetical protein
MKTGASRFIGPLLAVMVFAGCQNHYALTYRPAPGDTSSGRPAPATIEPQVVSTKHLNDEAQVWQASGYTVIGSSSFRTADRKPEWARRAAAREQAKLVGADVVLLTMENAGKITTTREVTPLNAGEPGHGGPQTESQTFDYLSCTAIYLRKSTTAQ